MSTLTAAGQLRADAIRMRGHARTAWHRLAPRSATALERRANRAGRRAAKHADREATR